MGDPNPCLEHYSYHTTLVFIGQLLLSSRKQPGLSESYKLHSAKLPSHCYQTWAVLSFHILLTGANAWRLEILLWLPNIGLRRNSFAYSYRCCYYWGGLIQCGFYNPEAFHRMTELERAFRVIYVSRIICLVCSWSQLSTNVAIPRIKHIYDNWFILWILSAKKVFMGKTFLAEADSDLSTTDGSWKHGRRETAGEKWSIQAQWLEWWQGQN